MARKVRHEEHVNHERWLVSYADFITLLFAFFVVMYSVSSVNEGKYRVLSDSLTSAFRQHPQILSPDESGATSQRYERGLLPIPGSMSQIDLPVQAEPVPVSDSTHDPLTQTPVELPTFEDPKMGEIADKITAAMESLIEDDLITVRRDARWLEVEINSSILYPSGSALLSPNAYPMLEQLAKILLPFQNPINVEGFTDNIPIHTVAFLSNWELSAARAASVVHLFMEKGVAPQRMAAIGYGEFKPVADNASAAGRAQNRRVVLQILPGEDPRWARLSAAEEAAAPQPVAPLPDNDFVRGVPDPVPDASKVTP